MQPERTNFARSGIKKKLSIGPTLPNPGPMLKIQAITAVQAVSKSILSAVSTADENKNSAEIQVMKPSTEATEESGIARLPMRTGMMAEG